MSEHAAIAEVNQQLSTDDRIELFIIDASNILDTSGVSVGVLRFCASTNFSNDNTVVFDGNTYTPIPVEASGFEWSGSKAFPEPRVRISNVGQSVSAAVITANHLVGATVTRLVTYRKFLDGMPDANPDATFEPDIYVIERLVNHTNDFIEWALSSSIDQEGKMIPARQCLQNTCFRRYRKWNGSSFNTYADHPCPYVGSSYFTIAGAITTNPALDRCSKNRQGCSLRFPNQALPIDAYFGIGRT